MFKFGVLFSYALLDTRGGTQKCQFKHLTTSEYPLPPLEKTQPLYETWNRTSHEHANFERTFLINILPHLKMFAEMAKL